MGHDASSYGQQRSLLLVERELLATLDRARHLEISFLILGSLERAAEWLGACGHPDEAAACWSAFDMIGSRTVGTLGDVREPAMTLDEARAAADVAMRSAGAYGAEQPHRVLGPGLDLTAREREVLRLLAAGRSDGQIAEELFITKSTAAVHVANIKGKLGATSRVEIAIRARELSGL